MGAIVSEHSIKILLYLAIGLGVGSLSGTLGIGGGVLLVPALIWLCQFEPARAAGMSLAVLMIPVCMPAAWKAFGQGRVDLEAALWIAAAFAIGAYGGSSMVPYLSAGTLRWLFGLLMIGVGLRFLLASHLELDSSVVTATLVAGLGLLGLIAIRRRPEREASVALDGPVDRPSSCAQEYYI
jgi:uncharacterized membrane protein YfcA